MDIRHAEPNRDAGACLDIYAPFVEDSAVSFEEAAPSLSEFTARIEHYTEMYPWLVLEDRDRIVGFAYAAAHRARAAYRWSCETSVYVDPDDRRRGIGRRLYEALLPLLVTQGRTLALAGITLPNPGSVALHEAIGFSAIGVYPGVGFKAGAWRDVGWWGLRLPGADAERPSEPGPPPRLGS